MHSIMQYYKEGRGVFTIPQQMLLQYMLRLLI